MVAVDKRGSDTEKTDETQIEETWALSVTMVNKSAATMSDMPGGSTEHHLAVTFLNTQFTPLCTDTGTRQECKYLQKKCHFSVP